MLNILNTIVALRAKCRVSAAIRRTHTEIEFTVCTLTAKKKRRKEYFRPNFDAGLFFASSYLFQFFPLLSNLLNFLWKCSTFTENVKIAVKKKLHASESEIMWCFGIGTYYYYIIKKSHVNACAIIKSYECDSQWKCFRCFNFFSCQKIDEKERKNEATIQMENRVRHFFKSLFFSLCLTSMFFFF